MQWCNIFSYELGEFKRSKGNNAGETEQMSQMLNHRSSGKKTGLGIIRLILYVNLRNSLPQMSAQVIE